MGFWGIFSYLGATGFSINLSGLVVISRMYIWYFVWRGRDFIISSLIKKHYAFPNVVVSKGFYVDYSHQQLWGIMNRFICIVNDSQDRLIVV